jgi:eukaryotic-like serine/threonine-protein kinase
MTDDMTEDIEFSPTSKLVAYRCSCGGEVHLPKGGSGKCAQCGRRVTLVGLDATQTISFCGDIGSGTSFHLMDGPDRSGEELGHFRLLSKLGYGGMGAVYRALDESLQRFVAVKVIRSQSDEGLAPDKQVTRLLDEAVAQARLNHPNVVTIFYVGRDRQDPFLAMELLPGPTLAALISDGPLPYKDVILYAQQIVSALRQASLLGIVHGDIKPSNLILAGEQIVKLGDFGLAQTESTAPIQGISGTLNYMAPELSMDGEPSDQSDMYSLGVTLFELTFGRRPYSLFGTTLREQISSQQGAEIEFPEKWPRAVPERWKAVLERLLARTPEQRYANYEAFEHELQSLAPVGVTSAGILIRGLAWSVDMAVQALFLLPFTIAAALPFISEQIDLPPTLGPFVRYGKWLGLLAFVVPCIFIWMEWRGWRTLGRYLFQLRVADEHGLWLSRRKRVLRSMIRNLPICVSAASSTLVTMGLPEFAIILSPVDEIVLLINLVPVLGPSRLALQDRLLGSHVVLDTVRKL